MEVCLQLLHYAAFYPCGGEAAIAKLHGSVGGRDDALLNSINPNHRSPFFGTLRLAYPFYGYHEIIPTFNMARFAGYRQQKGPKSGL
jgi:hypothetical protein